MSIQGVAQPGSASVLGTECRRFKSCHLDLIKKEFIAMVLNSKSRPLSPHLTIYKAQLTSSLSIFHRISGVSLGLSFIFYIFYYSFTSYYLIFYPFYILSLFLLSNKLFLWLIIIVFSLLMIALHYHATNGLRHIAWDFGFFLDIKNVYYSGFIGCFIAILWFSINSLRFIYS